MDFGTSPPPPPPTLTHDSPRNTNVRNHSNSGAVATPAACEALTKRYKRNSCRSPLMLHATFTYNRQARCSDHDIVHTSTLSQRPWWSVCVGKASSSTYETSKDSTSTSEQLSFRGRIHVMLHPGFTLEPSPADVLNVGETLQGWLRAVELYRTSPPQCRRHVVSCDRVFSHVLGGGAIARMGWGCAEGVRRG